MSDVDMRIFSPSAFPLFFVFHVENLPGLPDTNAMVKGDTQPTSWIFEICMRQTHKMVQTLYSVSLETCDLGSGGLCFYCLALASLWSSIFWALNETEVEVSTLPTSPLSPTNTCSSVSAKSFPVTPDSLWPYGL